MKTSTPTKPNTIRAAMMKMFKANEYVTAPDITHGLNILKTNTTFHIQNCIEEGLIRKLPRKVKSKISGRKVWAYVIKKRTSQKQLKLAYFQRELRVLAAKLNKRFKGTVTAKISRTPMNLALEVR